MRRVRARAGLDGGRWVLHALPQAGARRARAPYRSLRAEIPPVLHESALQVAGYQGHHLLVRIQGDRVPVEAAIRELEAAGATELVAMERCRSPDEAARTRALLRHMLDAG